MRLWHKDLIPYLPKQQLLGQWRELNSIYVKQNRHILINYVYEYDKNDLLIYSLRIIMQMCIRGYKVSFVKFCRYFGFEDKVKGFAYRFKQSKELLAFYSYAVCIKNGPGWVEEPFPNHHNEEYLKICCWNLYEKYLRGQDGFTEESIKFIKEKL